MAPDVVEDEVRNLDLHRLPPQHVAQQRIIRRSLQGKRATAEQAVVDILFQLNVGNTRERASATRASKDALAGDNALGGHRVGWN